MRAHKSAYFSAVIKTIAIAGAVTAAFGTQAFGQTAIKIGRTTGASGFHIPSYIAMERGFFKQEGLDAKFVAMTGKALV